jgi:transcriptional regulator with XRE-family HTH domain
MKNFKENLLENDFGAYLYDLRSKKEYTVEELAQKMDMENVTIKSIKKWEHDLEFPTLEQIYKLSEIYEVPSEEIMQVRTRTLEEGLKGVHKEIIRFIGYILGFSIYGTIIISYIIIAVAFVYSIWFFVAATKSVQMSYGIEV